MGDTSFLKSGNQSLHNMEFSEIKDIFIHLVMIWNKTNKGISPYRVWRLL